MWLHSFVMKEQSYRVVFHTAATVCPRRPTIWKSTILPWPPIPLRHLSELSRRPVLNHCKSIHLVPSTIPNMYLYKYIPFLSRHSRGATFKVHIVGGQIMCKGRLSVFIESRHGKDTSWQSYIAYLNRLFMSIFCRSNKLIVGNIQQLEQILKTFRHVVAKFLGWNALLGCRLFDFL